MKKLAFLNGIRGWGALVVVLYHFFVNALPASPQSAEFLRPIFLFNGHLAVWLFFIVSGFSLSIGYATTRDRLILYRIAFGRYLRLAIPILAFSLIMCSLIRSGFVPAPETRPEVLRGLVNYRPEFPATILYGLYHVFVHYETLPTLIPPLWTMPIELAGSFLVLAVCAIFRQRNWSTCLYVISFVAFLFINPFYSAFFAGVLFADIYSRGITSQGFWIPLVILVSGIILSRQLSSAGAPLYLTVSIILFYGMIYTRPVRRFLENGVSKFLGRISFTLYLLHAIILFSFAIYLRNSLGASETPRYTNLLLVINVAAVVASVALSRGLVYIDECAVLMSRKFSGMMVKLIGTVYKGFGKGPSAANSPANASASSNFAPTSDPTCPRA